MQNLLLDPPPPSSSSPPPPALHAEVAAQLRSALIALRDLLFDLQDSSTRLTDVIHDLHELVLKMEATLVPPATKADHGQ